MKNIKKSLLFLFILLALNLVLTAEDESGGESFIEQLQDFGAEDFEESEKNLEDNILENHKDYIVDDFGTEIFESDSDEKETEDFDLFDDLFNESEDLEDAVISEDDTESGKIANTEVFKSLTLTGTLSSDFGGFVNYDLAQDDWDGGGVFLISNTLYLSARASKDLNLNGSFTTSLSNKFAITLNTLYFDYLIKDLVFVTAGKRSFSWGYPLLFANGDLFGSGNNSYGLPYVGPAYTNVLEISSNHAVFQVKLPWTSGTFTFMALYDFDKLSGNVSWMYLSYATSLEFTVLNQAINLFARTYAYEETLKETENKVETVSSTLEDSESIVEGDVENTQKETEVAKFGYWMHPIVGMETKRTILGTDFYAQAQFRLLDFKMPTKGNIDYAVGTGGFYKLFDTFDPNIGFAVEYQYVYDPNKKKETEVHNHKMAVEFGMKRLGHDKNLKFGIDWGYNFSTGNGLLACAFYVSNIFRHGQWKNVMGMSYGKNMENPKFMLGSIISISMSY